MTPNSRVAIVECFALGKRIDAGQFVSRLGQTSGFSTWYLLLLGSWSLSGRFLQPSLIENGHFRSGKEDFIWSECELPLY
jgi:hypothetical protein